MSRRRRSGSISVDVDIDAWEVLEQISDDDLLEECRDRKLSTHDEGEPIDLDFVREAYDALNRGNAIEARRILDGLLFPKWRRRSDCEQQYKGFFPHLAQGPSTDGSSGSMTVNSPK